MPEKDLQLILIEMIAETADGKINFEIVRRWQEKYPELKREIAEAVADWREFEFFALEDETEELPPLSATAKNAMETALARSRKTSENFTDLREMAKKKGVEREGLLVQLGVSETLMQKIERRNLEQIPRSLQEKLADILRVSLESLQAFLALPPLMPPAASYKAKGEPQAQPKQTFAEAVRNDPELSAEEKARLLNLIESEK